MSYLSICEEKHHIFAFYASHFIEPPEVLMEAVIVVASAQFDLKAAVPTHVGCQPSEGLLTCASHPHKQGISSLLANHTSNPTNKEETAIVNIHLT